MGILEKKVLVVDDDPVIGRSFSGVLSGKGYAVITARDGEEALKKINSEKYDIVFTDIKMPGISGIEVAKRIREKQPWLPVVIITGFGSDDNRKQAEAAGVSDFLNKPLSPEMIEKSAAEALQHEVSAAPVSEEKPAEAPAAKAEEDKTERALESVIVFPRNVKLYFAAPFIGLAHTITLPLEGFDMLAAMGEEGLVKRGVPNVVASFLRNVAFISVAPLMELLYLAALPLAGLGILSWMGLRELARLFGSNVGAEPAREHREPTSGTTQEGAQRAVLQIETASEKAEVERAPTTVGGHLKHTLMLFTAPFVGLVYIITFPFVGLSTLAVMGAREMVRSGVSEGAATRIKNVILFFVAPFVGLAYMIALPFVGFGVLAWMTAKAAKSRFVK